MPKQRKFSIRGENLEKLVPEIRRLAKKLTHQQIADKLNLAVNTVSAKAKGVVRETPKQETRYATDAEQKGKAKYVHALIAQNERFAKKGQHGKILSDQQILVKLSDKFGTTFSKITLAKVKNDKKFIPQGRAKIEKLPGETRSKAQWRIATEARAAVAGGTATPKQIKIVEDLNRWSVGQAIRAAENRVYTEGGKSNRDFSFLDNMSDEAIDRLAIDRGTDTYYSFVERSNIYKTDPVSGVKTKIASSLTTDPSERKQIKQWFIDRQRESFKHRNPLLEGDHIITRGRLDKLNRPRGGMKFRGAPEPWVSGLSNMINLQALKYAENAAKSDIFTEKDAAKIERQMMRELAKKGLANLKGLPFGVGIAGMLGASMLPSQSAEASNVRGRMGENLTNPNWMFSMATGLPEDFLPGVAQGKKDFSGSSYGEDWDRFKDFWGSAPRRFRSLFD